MVTEHLYGNIFARDTDRVLTHLYLLCDAECKSTKKKTTRCPCIIDASIDAQGCITHGVKHKAWQEILRLNHQGPMCPKHQCIFMCHK